MQKPGNTLLHTILSWVFPGLIGLGVIYILHLHFFGLANISSSDMQPNHQEGDLVFVNKISREFKRGDIIAFKYYQEDTILNKRPFLFIQRCLGTPGDTIEISNGYIYVNGNEEKYKYDLKYNFRFKLKHKPDSLFLAKYKLLEGGQISDELDFSFSMTKEMADSLKKDSLIVELERTIEKSDARDEEIFPHNKNYNWNKHQVEKLYLPKKGDTIALDTLNLPLYRRIISEYEDNKLEVKNDSIFINGQLTKNYEIKGNYYFVLGDNRDNAVDSRFWGFLPEKLIQGKYVFTVLKRNSQ